MSEFKSFVSISFCNLQYKKYGAFVVSYGFALEYGYDHVETSSTFFLLFFGWCRGGGFSYRSCRKCFLYEEERITRFYMAVFDLTPFLG